MRKVLRGHGGREAHGADGRQPDPHHPQRGALGRTEIWQPGEVQQLVGTA
jgi:hypothetical protein